MRFILILLAVSAASLSVTCEAATYFVNDGRTNGDVYCSVVGSDTNTGTNAASPMLTITNLLAVKDVEPGDTVYIDTGVYSNYGVVVDASDAGSGSGYVTFQGSTNSVAGGSIIRPGLNVNPFTLSGAPYVQLCDLKLVGGDLSGNGAGLFLQNSANCVFRGVYSISNSTGTAGVFLFNFCNNAVFDGCVFYGHDLYMARVLASTNCVFQNCVFWGPSVSVFSGADNSSISNSIIRGSGSVVIQRMDFVQGDYNVYWPGAGTILATDNSRSFETLSDFQQAYNRERHSSVFDPRFANPTNWDFHLLSQTGRYVAGVGWTNDTATSGAIDMGYPAAAYSNEPTPNGSRVNVGSFGNTIEASKSPTNARLLALTFNDGGTIAGTGALYWAAVNFSNTATVKVQCSLDDGNNWSNIATGVRATNETVLWNTTVHESSARARWRVVSESDSNVNDQVDRVLSVHNSNLTFYVNDSITNGDVFTSAAGASTNSGVTASSPKKHLQEILDTYDVNGGDTIYIDTGLYVLTNATITMGLGDVGSSGSYLVVQGSTNTGAGGSVFQLVSPSYAMNVMSLSQVSYVRLSDLTAMGANIDGAGFFVNQSPNNEFVHVNCKSNSYGIYALNASHNNSILNSVFPQNLDSALRFQSSTNITVQNCVLWGDRGVDAMAGSLAGVSNTIIRASGAGNRALWFNGGQIVSDYNLFMISNGAAVAYSAPSTYGNLSTYQKVSSNEWHSLAADPLFADPASHDFHLKSVAGRWTGTSWTNDPVMSPAVDLGSPTSPYTNEPLPNGARINVGIYGNTTNASMSRTNAWLQVLTFNDGGVLNVPGDVVYWTAGNIPGGSRVRIDVSLDSGESWEVVQTGLLASAGSYTWANTNYDSSRFARWRVVYEADTNVYSFTATNCVYRKGFFPYYVNDNSTYGDIYCSAIGNDANLGSSRGSPKATLKAVLDEHDLEPGDVIYIDTGMYLWPLTPVVGALDSGSTNEPVYIQGSTNELFGGTQIDGLYLGIVLDINGGQYIDLSNVTVTNAGSVAVRLLSADGTRLYNVSAVNSREHGIVVSSSDKVQIQRCVIAGSVTNGVLVSGSAVMLENNVLWRNAGPGLRVDSGRVGVSNSVIVAAGNRSYCYYGASITNIVGDYNDLYTESNGVVGYVAGLGRNLDTLSTWTLETGSESHSLGVDPLFADPDRRDFHLKTEASLGRYQPGVGWVLDSETSALIDSGNPSFVYTNEPAFNGSRINIGLHGNHPEASKGRTNRWLHSASLRQGGGVRGTNVSLYWVAGNMPALGIVRVGYSSDGGATWSSLGTPRATNEFFVWDTTRTNDTPAGLWRVVYLSDTNVFSQTTNFFCVRNTNLSIYVNDASTTGDMYTSAGGLSTNWVASTNRPIDSLATALSIYDVEPGDIIYVDTGIYSNTANPRVSRLDGGSPGAIVRITGSTNESFGGSVLYRGSQAEGTCGLHLDAANWVATSNMILRNARTGLMLNDAVGLSFGNVRLLGNASNGVEILASSNVAFSRVVSAENGLNGVQSKDGEAISWQSSVLWSNRQGAVMATAGSMVVSNSVLQASGVGRCIYELASNAVLRANYNAVVADDQANVANDGGTVSKTLIRWQQSWTNDTHSLSQNPLFADAPNGDYHLRSQAGRFSVAVTNFVTTDTNTSLLIDCGDPLASYGVEPPPNGARLNIGLYGNSGQASMSRTNGWLLALTLSDGGNVRGTNTLRWVAGGAATNHQVYIDFSADGGVTWSNIATNVFAGTGMTPWNSADYRSTSRGRWRVVSQSDGSIRDETDSYFALNNESLAYYVNDTSTIHDVYCSAEGSIDHDGLSEDLPLPSIQDVLDRYDLVPGDRILVDTGTYLMTNNITIGSAASGLTTNQLVIQGSTNWAFGGTILDRQNGSLGVFVDRVGAVAIRDLNIINAQTGLRMMYSTNCQIDRVLIRAGVTCFELEQCANTRLASCAAVGASTNGLLDLSSTGTVWQSGVLWSNGWSNGVSVRLAYSKIGAIAPPPGSVAVYNSVIGVGPGSYAYGIEYGTLTADYNDLHLDEGAFAAVRQGGSFSVVYDTVSRWSRDSGQDRHSLSVDPKFYDVSSGDFHLMSRTGRYDRATSGFVADAETSPLVDAGNPASTWTNEPVPNGSRLNIGLFGDTFEESKTPTNPALHIITLNDGGRFEGTNYLYWVARGAATSHYVTLKYSFDDGITWTNIATGQLASAGSYLWDSTKYTSSLFGAWMIASEQDLSVTDKVDSAFALRNGALSFYVNDGFTNGDVYCSTNGSPTNSGLSRAAPKDTLQGILDAWDLEPGDTVYVDSGTYTGTTRFGQFDSGSLTSSVRVVIQGSTNTAVGGSVVVGSGSGPGVDINQAASIELRNLAFRGFGTGVRMKRSYNCVFEWVDVVGGSAGFELDASYGMVFRHCLARNATSAGLLNAASSNTIWQSGVLWSNATAVHLRDSTNDPSFWVSSVNFSNSVAVVYGSGGYAYKIEAGRISADHNDVYLLNGAYAATIPPTNSPIRGNPDVPIIFSCLSRWTRDTGRDRHSYSVDPGFADPGNGDFHLKSQAGRYDPISRSTVTDTVSSVLIDGGNPAWGWSAEPSPNGARLNIGLYGNSGEESMTPTNSALSVLSLNDGGRAEGTNVLLIWTARGDVRTQAVQLAYSPDLGATWTSIVAGVAATNGQYVWDTTAYTSSVRALWRVASGTDSNAFDVTDQPFALRNASFVFYVNDTITNGDVYCTSTGRTANLGLTPSEPKVSVESILSTWDLESGDTILVDTGVYSNDVPITIEQPDAAGISNQVRMVVRGSTNYAAGGTTIDRLNAANGVEILQSGGVEIRDIRIRNALIGVRLNESDSGVIDGVDVVGGITGFQIDRSSGFILRHNSAKDGSFAGVYLTDFSSKDIHWQNGVLWSNQSGVCVAGNGLTFSNSVVGVFGSDRYAYLQSVGTAIASDYNGIYLTDGALALYKAAEPQPIICQSVSRLSRDFGVDRHTFSVDPKFFNGEQGDFHLLSKAGRYSAADGAFINDAETSPLIDAGSGVWTNEPSPNGGRLNIGRFGNTWQASKTSTNASLAALSLNDGGRVEGVWPLYWVAQGDAAGHSVRLEYSADAGATWLSIVTNIPAIGGFYVWDTRTYPSGIRGVWRVTSENDTNIYGQSEQLFALRNQPLSFFVNDDSTNGDVYCSVVGSAGNSGVFPSSPKDSVQDVLDEWDLEPGDTIYVDTGNYVLPDTIRITQFDAWDQSTNLAVLRVGFATNRMLIQGSTNEVAGGSLFIKFGGGDAFWLNEAPGVMLRHLTIRNADSGVYVDNSPYSMAQWVRCENGTIGFDVDRSKSFRMEHCVARGNTEKGLSSFYSDGTEWRNGILWSNMFGAYQEKGSLTVENSILGAFTRESFAHFHVSGTYTSDYNNFYLYDDAFAGGVMLGEQVGGITTRYESVYFWSRGTGKDTNSLSFDPGFADLGIGDFHLKTTQPGGRYDPYLRVWTNDLEFSQLIDSGNPLSGYTNEPAPNGSRINIGLYGNSSEASMTPTGGWFSVITLNDGGRVGSLATLNWLSGGSAIGQLAYLDFSPDGGLTWTNITSNVLMGVTGTYNWDTTTFGRCAAGLWRIVSCTDSNLFDVSDKFFTMPGPSGSISYYVNDNSTNGDVYCSAIGNATNLGIVKYAPADSIQTIIGNFKLEPVDIVYIDTGIYPLTADIVIGDLDSGSETNHVIFRGSTNDVAGGSVLDRQVSGGGTRAILLNDAVGIELHDLILKGAQDGVRLKRSRHCFLDGVRAQENGAFGFAVEESTRINFSHCVSWGNGDTNGAGLLLDESDVIWSNGTMWGNASAVRFVERRTNRFVNSVFDASGPGQRVFLFDKTASAGLLISDYNNLCPKNEALIAEQEVAEGGNEIYGRLIDWQRGLTQDVHSLSHEPLFVNELAGDFRLKSRQGRMLPGGGMTNDAVTSPMLDVGDPTTSYTNEVDPNGFRVNIGNYGDTRAASLSLTNPWVLALTLNDGGSIRGTNRIYWAYGALSNSSRVRLEFSRNNGIEWSLIESNVLISSTGYLWDVSSELPSSFCRWRVISENPASVTDEVDSVFGIKNQPLTIYVNDTNTMGDMYCSAPGASVNSGLASNAPLDDPSAAILRYYDLLSGDDVIYIDTGVYLLTNSIALRETVFGSSGHVIRVQGSTNAFRGGTLIHRNDPAGVGIDLSGTRWIEVDHVRLTGAGTGVRVGDSGNCSLNWVECFSNAADAFLVNSSDFVFLDRCQAWNNMGWGLVVAGISDVRWDHGVIWSNRLGAVNAANAGADTSVSNSILHASGSGSFVYQFNQAQLFGDYNVLLAQGSAALGRDIYNSVVYPNLQEWQKTRGMDVHSGLFNPLFADAGTGNFHLRSEAGRYTFGGWPPDTNTSWAIDAGNPAAAYANETTPNGTRLDAGLYGNTVEASRSLTNESRKALLVVSLNDGGLVQGTKLLYWLSRAMSPTDTVRIEYSGNGGTVWTVLATNVSATSAGYSWNPSFQPSAQLCLWKVVLESNEAVADTNDASFVLRNGPMTFYVNDDSQLGDIYTAAIGSVTNDGYTTNTPKSRVQDILAYDLEGGDRVLVDTGYYPLTNEVFIGIGDSGVNTALVSVIGSTNLAFGGSIMNGQHTNYTESVGFHLRAASYVELRNFTVQACDWGLLLDQAAGNNLFSNLLMRGNGNAGVRVLDSVNNRFSRSVVTRSTGAGFLGYKASGILLDRCVVWSNSGSALDLSDCVLGISNSVLSASGEDNYCYKLSTNTILRSDYNDLYISGGANYGLINSVPVEGIPQWTALTTQDVHSLSADPLFFDPNADDYHVRSRTGRYDPSVTGFVTTDTNFSYLIDAGSRTSPWTNEPDPSGSRINIGLYGNTTQASKSQTNEWLMALTASSGGRLEGIFYLVWNAGGMSPTSMVSLDYSFNNAASWTSIVRSVSITNGQYLWNSAETYPGDVERWPSSPIGRWRVRMDSNTNVYDITDSRFALRNRLFTYYLNDSVTNGDIYTSVVGSDTNLGFYPWSPMATLKTLLDVHDIEGEDIIKIDTGVYPITTNDLAVLGPADQGRVGFPVEIMGNTNALVSVFDRASHGGQEVILAINGSYVNLQALQFLGGHMNMLGGNTVLRNVVITNGTLGLSGPNEDAQDVRVDNGSVSANGDPVTLSRITIKDGGFNLSGTNITVQNSLVYGSNGPAVTVNGSAVLLRNNTLAGSGTQFRQTGFGGSTLEDCIIVASGLNNYCLLIEGGTLNSDYNNLVARNGAWIGTQNGSWEKLLYWQRVSGRDLHSISADPKFADEAARDYHLKSVVGRWTGSAWTTDAVHSASIDAGNPNVDFSNEPVPRGDRVNLGVFGNTTQESKSQTNAWLLALTMNDGGVLKGTNVIQWRAGNLGTTDLVRLEYSPNSGVSWTNIATGLSALAQQYAWNTTIFTSSLQALWRVVLQTNVSIVDQVDTNFAVRNTPLNFYVNDAFTNGDVYCSTTGTLTGTGLATNSPKLAVQDILSAYDTEAGDTIYVDTGNYDLTNDILVIWSRGGDESYGNVLIRGSTNVAAGGSRMSRNDLGGDADAFDVKASHVTLRDFTVRSGYRGVYLESNIYCSVERILAVSNYYGIVNYSAISATNTNIRLWNNTRGGIDVTGSRTTLVANCTFVGNSNYCIRALQSVNNAFENNIFVVPNTNSVALAGDWGVIRAAFIDYNIYYFLQTSFIYEAYRDLRSWQLNEEHDYRSAVTNPLLANAAAGDFHEKSTAGRYLDGTGWVLDGSNSWAMDRGNPEFGYSLEPQTNGERINIGAYGNTEYASKGSTNSLVYVRTLNDPTSIGETNSAWALIWTVQNVPRPWLVKVQYSGDGGTNWVNIATGVYAFAEYVLWQTTPYYNTYKGRWRVISEADPAYWDMNDSPFNIFYGVFQLRPDYTFNELRQVTWRGAWDENYQVQYATSNVRSLGRYIWTNAVTGTGVYQKAFFRSTYGGDLVYEDPESSNRNWKVYRVIWQP